MDGLLRFAMTVPFRIGSGETSEMAPRVANIRSRARRSHAA